MRKSLVLFLFAVGILLIGWTGYDYSTSGQKVVEFDLTGEAGNSALIDLDPSMNPMRAFLTVIYGIELRQSSTPAFTYDLRLNGPGGLSAFEATGQQRDKRDENISEYVTKTSEQVVSSFTVAGRGAYFLDWKVTPENADIKTQSLSLRRNVHPLRIFHLITGITSFALGFLLLLLFRQKGSGSGRDNGR
ncbi:hypothetical protein [Sneathiella sp.]|uniref:hypothetical protein n=1 Tax=Sneathiella sp. TaxID=1964365 RepID=UPI003565FA42